MNIKYDLFYDNEAVRHLISTGRVSMNKTSTLIHSFKLLANVVSNNHRSSSEEILILKQVDNKLPEIIGALPIGTNIQSVTAMLKATVWNK